MTTKTAARPTAAKTAAKPEAPKLATFELGDEEKALIAPKGGRVAKPSVYLAEVRAAIESGKAMGIPVTATVKGAWILGQLRKAAKELSTEAQPVKLKMWNREDATPRPFVGFQVVTDGETENSEA